VAKEITTAPAPAAAPEIPAAPAPAQPEIPAAPAPVVAQVSGPAARAHYVWASNKGNLQHAQGQPVDPAHTRKVLRYAAQVGAFSAGTAWGPSVKHPAWPAAAPAVALFQAAVAMHTPAPAPESAAPTAPTTDSPATAPTA